MFDKILNISLVSYGIAILKITLLEAFLYLNCRFCVYNVTARILSQTIFQGLKSGWLIQISQEIIVMSCFPCSVSFKNYIYVTSFGLWWKPWKFEKIYGIIFETCFHLDEIELIRYLIKMISHYLILNYNGNQSLKNMSYINLQNTFLMPK